MDGFTIVYLGMWLGLLVFIYWNCGAIYLAYRLNGSRFSVRTMLVVMTLVAIALGLLAYAART